MAVHALLTVVYRPINPNLHRLNLLIQKEASNNLDYHTKVMM